MIVLVANGESSWLDADGSTPQRESVAEKACAVLGAETPLFLNLLGNKFGNLPLLDIVQKLEAVLEAIDPELVYTHHGVDLNAEYQITHRSVMTACRSQPHSNVKAIFSVEVLSSTRWNSSDPEPGFRPVRFVDLNKHFARKLSALECCEAKMRPIPHPRSYEGVVALAILRGVIAGLKSA